MRRRGPRTAARTAWRSGRAPARSPRSARPARRAACRRGAAHACGSGMARTTALRRHRRPPAGPVVADAAAPVRPTRRPARSPGPRPGIAVRAAPPSAAVRPWSSDPSPTIARNVSVHGRARPRSCQSATTRTKAGSDTVRYDAPMSTGRPSMLRLAIRPPSRCVRGRAPAPRRPASDRARAQATPAMPAPTTMTGLTIGTGVSGGRVEPADSRPPRTPPAGRCRA